MSDSGGQASDSESLQVFVNVSIAVVDLNEPPVLAPRMVYLPENMATPGGDGVGRGEAAVGSRVQANWTDWRYTGINGRTRYASRVDEYDSVLPSLQDHLDAAVFALDPDFPGDRSSPNNYQPLRYELHMLEGRGYTNDALDGNSTTWTPQNASVVQFDVDLARGLCENDTLRVATAQAEGSEAENLYWQVGCDYFGVGRSPGERFRFEIENFGPEAVIGPNLTAMSGNDTIVGYDNACTANLAEYLDLKEAGVLFSSMEATNFTLLPQCNFSSVVSDSGIAVKRLYPFFLGIHPSDGMIFLANGTLNAEFRDSGHEPFYQVLVSVYDSPRAASGGSPLQPERLL